MKAELRAALAAASSVDALAERLFAALGDRSIADDAALPCTGIPLHRERHLSAAFIGMPEARYGTRCSTLIVTERGAHAPTTHVFERGFDAHVEVALRRVFSLRSWPPRGPLHESAGDRTETSP